MDFSLWQTQSIHFWPLFVRNHKHYLDSRNHCNKSLLLNPVWISHRQVNHVSSYLEGIPHIRLGIFVRLFSGTIYPHFDGSITSWNMMVLQLGIMDNWTSKIDVSACIEYKIGDDKATSRTLSSSWSTCNSQFLHLLPPHHQICPGAIPSVS